MQMGRQGDPDTLARYKEWAIENGMGTPSECVVILLE